MRVEYSSLSWYKALSPGYVEGSAHRFQAQMRGSVLGLQFMA